MSEMRILLVEDNQGDARLLQEMVREAGGEGAWFVHVRSLVEAYELLDRERFDVVLLDLGLPDGQGINSFTQLHEKYPDVPIVILSGLNDEDVAIAAVQQGAQDYLVKRQISGGAVLRSLRYAIERHKAMARELGQVRRGGESGIMAFVGAKGGVGTTTLVLNLAALLATRGRTTLAAEIRGRYGTLSALLSRTPNVNISHLMEMDPAQITPPVVEDRLLRTPFGLGVLFGPQEAREEVELAPEHVAAVVDSLGELAEYVVLDIPAFPCSGAREALRHAWRVFLCLEPEPSCLRAARVAVDVLRTIGVVGQLVGAIAINRAALPTAPNVEEMSELIDIDVLGVLPPAAEACAASERSGIPLVLAQPDNVYTMALAELADRIIAPQMTTAVW